MPNNASGLFRKAEDQLKQLEEIIVKILPSTNIEPVISAAFIALQYISEAIRLDRQKPAYYDLRAKIYAILIPYSSLFKEHYKNYAKLNADLAHLTKEIIKHPLRSSSHYLARGQLFAQYKLHQEAMLDYLLAIKHSHHPTDAKHALSALLHDILHKDTEIGALRLNDAATIFAAIKIFDNATQLEFLALWKEKELSFKETFHNELSSRWDYFAGNVQPYFDKLEKHAKKDRNKFSFHCKDPASPHLPHEMEESPGAKKK